MLVDTNIISELARPNPNEGVLSWSAQVTRIHISVVTLEELNFGLAWKNNPRISQWLEGFLEMHCTLLPVTPAIARLAGQLRGHLQKQELVRHQADMLIAATAAVHGLPLITRNEKDFTDCGITVINPFA
jgi:predicted nucleic acid-binding protein